MLHSKQVPHRARESSSLVYLPAVLAQVTRLKCGKKGERREAVSNTQQISGGVKPCTKRQEQKITWRYTEQLSMCAHRQRHIRRLREAVVFIVQLRKVVLGKLKSAGVPPHPREKTLQKPSWRLGQGRLGAVSLTITPPPIFEWDKSFYNICLHW